jgi:hypothetical protein
MPKILGLITLKRKKPVPLMPRVYSKYENNKY